MQTYDPHKDKTEVRQGNDRRMNLRVLVLSSVGILVVFTLIYIAYNFATGGMG